MRCISCGMEVPPQFIKAIESNECPGCGGEILANEQIGLLNELISAISIMPSDSRGLANWLVSNYRMKKIGDAEPIQKLPGKQVQSKGVESSGFASRANVDLENNERLKNKKLSMYAKAIEDAGSDDAVTDSEESGPDIADQKVFAELKRQGINPFERPASPQVFTFNEDEEDAGFKTTQEKALEATPEGRKFLEQQRMKKILQQQGGGQTRFGSSTPRPRDSF